MSRLRRAVALLLGLAFLVGSVPGAAFACDTHSQHAASTSHAMSHGSTVTSVPSAPDTGGCGMHGATHVCAAMTSCAPVALRAPMTARAMIRAPKALRPAERPVELHSRVAAPDVPPPRI